jgi:hypothetical protein
MIPSRTVIMPITEPRPRGTVLGERAGGGVVLGSV